MKKVQSLLAAALLTLSLAGSCQARTSESIAPNEGYGPYHGFVVADMSMENGVASSTASYSMRMFRDFGLVPVAYCSSGGSRIGSYYTFYVNPYHDCLIIGRGGHAGHGDVFGADLRSFDRTGEVVHYTDLGQYQDFYRKVIKVAKAEFEKYQELVNKQ